MNEPTRNIDYTTCPYTDHLCGYHAQCDKCRHLWTIRTIYTDKSEVQITIPVHDIRYATSHQNGLYHLSRNILVHTLSRLGFDIDTINSLFECNHLEELPDEEL